MPDADPKPAGPDPKRPAGRTGPPGLSPLGQRLNSLANFLFGLAALVFLIGFIGAFVGAGTQVETFGLVEDSVEESGRSGVVLFALGAGLTAAGVIAGLAGILKALVRREDLGTRS